MSIHDNTGLMNLLAQGNLTPKTLGLEGATQLERTALPSYTPSFFERLSLADKVVIAAGCIFATSLIIFGALAIRAEVVAIKNGSFLTKITAKGGCSMIGAAVGIALLSALFVKFHSKSAKELPAFQGHGLHHGKDVLLVGNFDPVQNGRPNLFIFNNQDELWHNGHQIAANVETVNDLPFGMELTRYTVGGTTLFTRLSYQMMKMRFPPYYQANFAAMRGC